MMTTTPFLLFVCTGNTCRSPMAESLWNTFGTEMVARSAGIAPLEGQPAAIPAHHAVRPYGGDLSRHRAHALLNIEGTPRWVLAMTREHIRAIRQERPDWADQTVLLTELAGEAGEIADPLGRGQAAYDMLAEQLYRLLKTIRPIILGEPRQKEE